MIKKNSLFIALFLCLFSFAQTKKFKVVIDAGHGGKDYGATYHGFIEKNIALKTTLKLGKLLEDEGIDVVYTREKDVFIELNKRAEIANDSKANLFISIHCNANANNEASGFETFVMGVTKNAANLEVAKKENAVVTLEANYKVKYEGFDPNKPESVIGLSIMQEENQEQSIVIAGKFQQNFDKISNFKNRGVKQAGFLVLKQIAMPRVLVEMGFISNKVEGEFLNSDEGQNKFAESMKKAVLEYKKETYFTENSQSNKNTTVTKTEIKKEEKTESKTEVKKEEKKTANSTSTAKFAFKVQISASTKKLETVSSNFKGLKNVSAEKENTVYKYYYGNTSDYNEAKSLLKEAKDKGYASSFIIALKNGKKVPISEAIK
jgi:N-acetylmuramoyl-L-alanine amidase